MTATPTEVRVLRRAPGPAVLEGHGPGSDDPALAGDGHTLVVAAFPDTGSRAAAARRLLKARARDGLDFHRLVILTPDDAGGMQVQMPFDTSARAGARYGLMTGLAVGLLLAPPILVSAVALATVGGLIGRASQQLERARLVRTLRGLLGVDQPGLLAVVGAPQVPRLLDAMTGATSVETAPIAHGVVGPYAGLPS